MKTQMLKIIPLLCFMFWQVTLHSQTINTTAGSTTSCPGGIIVSIDATNCNNVGAISLMLGYNNTVLTYQGYQNLNSQLSTGLLIINPTGSSVVISWASTTPANIGDGTLVELLFNGIPGSSNLDWDTQTSGNCEYSDANGNILPATFANGTATIDQPPLVTTQPTDRTVLVGLNTSFSLSGIGTGLALLWQLSTDGGGSWSDLSNNATYSGVTSSTLNITNALLTYNGYKYRCRLTGTCAPVVYSNVVILTVIDPITASLPTESFCPGSINVPVTLTNFTSVASFSLTYSYDTTLFTYTGYQSLNASLSGGTFVSNAAGGNVFISWSSTTAVTFGDGTLVEILFTAATGNRNFSWNTSAPGACEFTDVSGSVISTIFVDGAITIYGVPTIVNHPVNRTIAKGLNTTFSITASGSGLTYLWQASTDNGSSWADLSNGGYYSNVTQATMNITNAQFILSGNQYRCKVTGNCTPLVYSNPGILTVLPNIITTCETVTGCPGQLVVSIPVTDFIEVGAFSMVLNYDPAILTYTGYQDLNTNLTGGTFAGNATGGKIYLSWSRTTTATIAIGDTLINLVFTGVTGVSTLIWDVGVQGSCEYNTGDGLIIFSTWVNGGVTVNQPPQITTQPANRTIYSGGSTAFSVVATGTGLSYLWQVSTDAGTSWSGLVNGSPYSGVTSAILTINPASQALDGYLYRCRVSGTCPSTVYSTSGELTVTPGAITTVASSELGSCTGNLNIPITVTNCINIGGISLTLTYDTTKLVYAGYNSVHSELTSGLLAIHAQGGKVRLSWASTNSAEIGNGTIVHLLFTAAAGSSTTLTWDSQTSGNCEYSYIDGTLAASLYTNGTITFTTDPLVINAGNDTTIAAGGTAQLNGAVSGGAPPYTYLWTPSTGLSNPSIPNPQASPGASTLYTLTINDNVGCYGSDGVTINVAGIPETLILQDINVGSGQSICYDATQTITVAGGGTYFNVQNGGSAVMIAGQSVHLLSGTRVYQGGYLHAYITTTGQYCASQSPSFLIAVQPEETLPLPELDQQSFFRVYPNPTNGNFIIELDNEDINKRFYLSVYGIIGNSVIRDVPIEGLLRVFSLSDQQAGIYIVRVYNEDQNQTRMLLKY